MELAAGSVLVLLTFIEVFLGYAYEELLFLKYRRPIYKNWKFYVCAMVLALLCGGYRIYHIQGSLIVIVAMSIYMTITCCVIKRRNDLGIISLFLLYNLVVCLLDLAGMSGDIVSFMTGKSSISNTLDIISALVLTRLILMIVYMFIRESLSEYEEPDITTTKKICWVLVVPGSIGIYIFRDVYRVNQNPEIITGFFIFVFFIISCIALYLYFLLHNLKSKKEYLDMQNHIFEEKYTELLKLEKQKSMIYHDFKNSILVLEGYLEAGRNDEAMQYLKEIRLPFVVDHENNCGNPVIDYVVAGKIETAEQHNIKVQKDISDLSQMDVKEYDLCMVLSNILDNAIEANSGLQADKWIVLKIHVSDRMLFVELKNTIFEQPKERNGKLISTKKDSKLFHGMGLESVNKIVEKYNGLFTYEYTKEYFLVKITLFY